MSFARLFVPAVTVALVSGCGGQSSNSGVASAGDIAAYQALSVDVQSAATAYRSAMTDPSVTTLADCRRIHDAYDAQIQPWIAQMMQRAGAMDGFMNDHGGLSVADMACDASLMADEMDHHDAVACSWPDLASDQAEAQRHADAMIAYAAHAQERCAEMNGGSGNWQWQPMMQQCQSWDGCCTDSMYTCCGGMMMHGGGMMYGNENCCP